MLCGRVDLHSLPHPVWLHSRTPWPGSAASWPAHAFLSDLAVVTVRGINIHPSIAKGRMVNAVRLAGMFLDRLPRQALAPETTADREGFLHPYQVEGGVAEVTLRVLLRGFLSLPWTELFTQPGANLWVRELNPDRFRAPGPLTSAAILLLDDTWTSGASVQSAAVALKRAGARSVAAVVLGRHGPPQPGGSPAAGQ